MAQAIRQGNGQTKENNIEKLRQPKVEEMEQELENVGETEANEEPVKGGQKETAEFPVAPEEVQEIQPLQTEQN